MFFSVLSSCEKRKNKLDRMNLIPEKELVSILTDLYISDGLISTPVLQRWFSSLDSASTYYYIIEKYGYSKETMDKTMRYYFIKKPKALIKIYDKVLGTLSEMESLIDKEIVLNKVHTGDQWMGKDFYAFPDQSYHDSTRFELNLKKPGKYTLSFSATFFPDDQSINPRVIAYLCHPDSIETGKREYFETLSYIKDGQPHSYEVVFKIPRTRLRYLKGCLYNLEDYPDYMEKHFLLEDISLIYSSSML